MHKCEKCNKEFEFNYLLTRHHNSIRKCDTPKKLNNVLNDKIKEFDDKITNIDNQIELIENEIQQKTEQSIKKINICMICKNTFLNKTNMMRHINDTCPSKKNLLTKKDILNNEKNKLIDEKTKMINNHQSHINQQLYQQQNNEIKKLRETVAKLMTNKNTINNITINNGTINNNNNNLIVNINSFGKENLSHITDKDYKKYMSSYFKGFLNFIERIHFDDNMPENQNICLSNIKSKYIYIYDEDKWITKDKKVVIDKFITNKYNLLVDKCEEFEENNDIDDKTLTKFTEFAKNYRDEEAQKNTKNNIEMMLYNNRDKTNKLRKNKKTILEIKE